MRWIRCAVLALVVGGVDGTTAVAGEQAGPINDLLIAGGTVIDGSGAPGRRADVLIDDGVIVGIGRFDPATTAAAGVVDATGRVVTPGFIDTHSHGDPLRRPGLENFLAMGVTTVCLGQDGASPSDLATWMRKVQQQPLGPNVAVFVGHGTVRDLAGVRLQRDPSPVQIAAMQREVRRALGLGCLGMTTGLEYQPGSFADVDELVALAEPVADAGGLVMSHMRSEDDDAIEAALAELLAQGRAGCPVHVSHIKVTYGRGAARAEQILQQLEAARQAGQQVTADIYPYNASYTGIGIVFPEWAKPPHDYAEVVRTRRAELAAYLRERVTKRNGPAATLLGTPPWTGQTLAEVAAAAGKPFEDVLIDDIGLGGAHAAYFVMDEALQERLLVDPRVMICSDGSPTGHHPRGHGAFARVLRKHVGEKKLLTLEAAVHKMTGLPADTTGLTQLKRGRIAVGWAADVLVFDPDRVRDEATYEQPHRLARGFDWVVVNGRIAREQDRATDVRSGRLLRRADHALHARVDALLAPYRGDGPGVSLAIRRGKQVVLTRSVGLARLDDGTPVEARTNFRLASVTKQFTAMAIMILAKQGKLSLDDSVHRYLPEMPAIGEQITVRHLLGHTSGVVDYETLIPREQVEQVSDHDVLTSVARSQETYFLPGERFRYSNSGYALLALIVERASGQRFADFLRTNIFLPLGMATTVAYEQGRSTVPRRALGYRPKGDAFVDADQSVTSAVLGDGGIYTNVIDYQQWAVALDSGVLVSPATMAEAVAPGRLNGGGRTQYGFGWRLAQRDGLAVQQHDGSTSGFNTAVRRVPEAKLTIVVLANREGVEARTIADALLGWMVAREVE